MRRARAALAFLPEAQDSRLRIRADPVTFDYVSTGFDDLQLASRLDFEAWEPISRWFFFLMAQTSARVVDVGAYSGVYSLTAALAGPRVLVTAFEPNPEMFALARRNVDVNGLSDRIALLPVALSDVDGTSHLYLEPVRGGTSAASLIGSGDRFVDVRVSTLDGMLGSVAVDLVKIDVEGGEAAAFRGAASLLQAHRPVILAEALGSDDLRGQFEALAPLGYGRPIPVSVGGTHGDERNYVWVGPERRAEVSAVLARARDRVAGPDSRRGS